MHVEFVLFLFIVDKPLVFHLSLAGSIRSWSQFDVLFSELVVQLDGGVLLWHGFRDTLPVCKLVLVHCERYLHWSERGRTQLSFSHLFLPFNEVFYTNRDKLVKKSIIGEWAWIFKRWRGCHWLFFFAESTAATSSRLNHSLTYMEYCNPTNFNK